MGFYITDETQDRAPRAAAPPWGPKPARGPIRGVISGYRFYNPDLGRWVNRDPIGERGGVNLYLFVENNSIIMVDALGRKTTIIINATEEVSVWALIYRIGHYCVCTGSDDSSCSWVRAGGEDNKGNLHTIVADWMKITYEVRYEVEKSGLISNIGTGVGMANTWLGLLIEALNKGEGSRDVLDTDTSIITPLPELRQLGECNCEKAGTAESKDEVHAKVFDRDVTVNDVTVPN